MHQLLAVPAVMREALLIMGHLVVEARAVPVVMVVQSH